MLPATQAFHDAMTAAERRIKVRVTIDYTDPVLDQSITITASEQSTVIGGLRQTANNLREAGGKFAALDGVWVLGGTWALGGTDIEAGWWGAQLAGTGGVFASPPRLTVDFADRPIRSLLVVGDSARAEWPVDFDVRVLNAAQQVLHLQSVRGNTQVVWEQPITAVTGARRMQLDILRWSHVGRHSKIVEFVSSVQETYENNEVLALQLLEEREVDTDTLPVGSISANELVVTLANVDRRFDAENPTSPLQGLLKPNRRVRAWAGAATLGGDEYVPLGIFWSGEWQMSGDGLSVRTTCRDRLEQLRLSTYQMSQVSINATLHALAVAVLQDAGLLPSEYFVDSQLQSFVIPYAYFGRVTHREALRQIAEACLGQVYCDRLGVVRVVIG